MEDGREFFQIPLSDAKAVRAILIEAARARRDTSYADLLDKMGYAFSRPKMRTLCKTLGAVDEAAVAAGEPELAVLVVRQSDRLPGDGWWVSEAQRLGYDGLWTGPQAVQFIRRRQKLVFDYWAGPGRAKQPRKATPPKKTKPPRKSKVRRAAAPAPAARKRRVRG